MRTYTVDGVVHVAADGYHLAVHTTGPAPPRAVLSTPDGAELGQLSLFASLDRVGAADETYRVHPPQVQEQSAGVQVTVRRESTAWQQASVVLRAEPDTLAVHASVTGDGILTSARLLGGAAVLDSGACGQFYSSGPADSAFLPNPTEPVQWQRPATSSAELGILGDAHPGRLHAVFSPPPLALALGAEQRWLLAWLRCGISSATFTRWRYEALDSGFRCALDYDAHTEVSGTFTTPEVVLATGTDPWESVSRAREDLLAAGHVPDRAGDSTDDPSWWHEPLFCGWGAQSARARAASDRPGQEPVAAADLARQDVYDELLATLAGHDVYPGTVVIDDKWQAAYGTCEVDVDKWPDLRGWIQDRHAAGQRVLLWWKAWDPEGLPAQECILDPAGRPVAADPANPQYQERIRALLPELLGSGGLNADGFKIDFTQRAPAGQHLRGTPGGPWGIAALHRLLELLYRAAKQVRPDALMITHTPNPWFNDVADMIRLNDVLERDPQGTFVPVADQVRTRARIAATALPGHPVDTDQWPMPDLAQWRDYTGTQHRLGVPALYYAESIDGSGEQLTGADYALVRRTWAEYRRRTGLSRTETP